MNNIIILGDSIKKSRFNKDLADVVNKDVESRLKREARNLRRNVKNNIVSVSSAISSFIIDLEPADGGDQKRYSGWVEYWDNNTTGNNRTMASCADYYTAFKQIKDCIDNRCGWEESARMFVNDMRSILDESDYNILTSTIIHYGVGSEMDRLNHAEIIHHYTCPAPNMRKEYVSAIPKFEMRNIVDILNTFEGQEYFTTLFDTEDDAETILSTLEFISGFKRDKITAFFEIDKYRKSYAKRNVVLYNTKSCGFCIDATFNHSDSVTSLTKSFTYGVDYVNSKVEQ